MAKFKVDDKIVFGRGKRNSKLFGVTVGKVYQLRLFGGALAFDTDHGNTNFPCAANYNGKPTKIVD